MKKILIALAVLALAVSALGGAYSIDLTLNATNGVSSTTVAEAFKPVNLYIWGATAADAGSTAVVSRVHNDRTTTVWTATFASNVTTASTVLTNAAWFIPNDSIRYAGTAAVHTNATIELNGDQ